MLRRIQQKKERRKKFFMGAVLVFLMAFSGAGILIGSQANEEWEYNGYEFSREGNAFVTKINKERVGFNYLPQTVDNINMSGNIKAAVTSEMMYLTFDPNAEVQDLLYIDTIRNDFERNLDAIVVSTMTEESNIYNLPVISCDNATPFVPVIYFHTSNQTSLDESNGCLTLNAQGPEFFKLRDLFMYIKLGVINA